MAEPNTEQAAPEITRAVNVDGNALLALRALAAADDSRPVLAHILIDAERGWAIAADGFIAGMIPIDIPAGFTSEKKTAMIPTRLLRSIGGKLFRGQTPAITFGDETEGLSPIPPTIAVTMPDVGEVNIALTEPNPGKYPNVFPLFPARMAASVVTISRTLWDQVNRLARGTGADRITLFVAGANDAVEVVLSNEQGLQARALVMPMVIEGGWGTKPDQRAAKSPLNAPWPSVTQRDNEKRLARAVDHFLRDDTVQAAIRASNIAAAEAGMDWEPAQDVQTIEMHWLHALAEAFASYQDGVQDQSHPKEAVDDEDEAST